MDVEAVKQAAAGRWHEFFASLGIPAERLTGSTTECPCPKCGGNTRFRLIDVQAGALFCSHCFSSENGDGFAATAWWFGLNIKDDFQEVVKKVADFFGVKMSTKKKKKSWKEKIKLLDWNDTIGLLWVSGRPPITPEAIQEAGAARARLYDEVVIAFPIHGDKKTIGYSMYSAMPTGKITHKTFIDGKLEKVEKLKVKTLKDDGKSGFLGPAERVRQAKFVIKAEGIPDMLAANSLLPREWAAICNVAGASEGPRPWILSLFQGKELGVVVHDCDKPGQKGAVPWSQGIAKHTSVKNVILPYPITEGHGRDLRDFLNERGIENFLILVGNTETFEPEEDESGQVKDVEPPAEEQEVFEKCLLDLGLDVFGETEDGRIYVYATDTRKTRVIQSIDRLKIENLIQIVGRRCLQYVSNDPDPHQYNLSTARRAIALIAAERQVDPDRFKGRGLWLIDGQVVAANGNHLSLWDGETLVSSDKPRIGDSVFQLTGLADNWFGHEEMAELCQHARDTKWCRAAMNQLITLLERWTWVNEKISPHLICSLAAATFLQSAWRIRPQIGISGTSGSGKSDLMKFLFGDGGIPGVFGRLRWSSGDTSGSGLTQSVKCNSLCIAIDEWDKIRPRYKSELREILRNMSSGQSRDRGSAHGKGRKEMLCHMLWFLGISLTMEEAADRNRVVQVGLVKAVGTKKWANFVQPGGEEAEEIGKRLIAAAIVHGARAIRMAVEVEMASVSDPANKDVDSRLLRIMSVPAACASVFSGGDFDGAKNASREYVSFVISDEEHETPESYTDLLNQILAADVDLGHGEKRPLSQILASYTERQSVGPILEAHGLKVVGAGDTRALAIGKIAKLVKESNDRDARRLLMQCPGAARGKEWIAGLAQRVVVIPWETLKVGEGGDGDTY